MIRGPPCSTPLYSSAASDVYKRQGLEGNITRECGQVANVIGQALEFERNSTNRLPARGLVNARERLNGPAECARVSDDSIPSNRLSDEHRSAALRTLEQTLDAAVLVAEHYFQRKHLFAVRMESKVTGLNDPGVHWADSDLVNFVAVDDVKREILAVLRSHGPCARRMIGRMATQRLERRMPLRNRAALFRYLALKAARLPARGRQRGILLGNQRAGRAQQSAVIISEHGAETKCPSVFGDAEQRHDAPASADRARYRGSEILHLEERNVGHADTPSIINGQERSGAHGATPPSNCAARASESCRGGGM